MFFATQPEQFTFLEAQQYCESQNATLASVGQLHAAWKQGLDRCYPGWLADGSLRYPIVSPRPACGGDAPGVRTIYQHYNQTGFPDPLSRHHAFCFRGTILPLVGHKHLPARGTGLHEGALGTSGSRFGISRIHQRVASSGNSKAHPHNYLFTLLS